MKIGYIGLGKMGKNMFFRLLEAKTQVVVWNRSQDNVIEVVKKGAIPASDFKDLVSQLPKTKIIWLMLPAGEVVDEMLEKLVPQLLPGDIVIDGGNSYYQDSIRRYKTLKEKGINFIDIGVSGGPSGARNGACLMVGGEAKVNKKIEGLVKKIACPGAYAFFNHPGAGHFVKMIHNGIEYGMMEAIAEGAAILQKSEFGLDLGKVFEIYNQGSVIESRLVGWAQEALTENPRLSGISSVINHTGEGEWSVKTARQLEIKVPVLADSLKVRFNSGKEPENFRNKVVTALRGKFGGHEVKNRA